MMEAKAFIKGRRRNIVNRRRKRKNKNKKRNIDTSVNVSRRSSRFPKLNIRFKDYVVSIMVLAEFLLWVF